MTSLLPLLLAAAWQVVPEQCDGAPRDDQALVDAIELELPPAPAASTALHVRACDGDVWVVRLDDTAHRFELASVVPRLQRRTLALLIRELLLHGAPDVSAPGDVQRFERVVGTTEPHAPPIPAWELSLAGRLFFDTPISAGAGVTFVARPWWRLVFSLTGLFSGVTTDAARVFVGFEVLGAGVRLVDLVSGPWRLGVELLLEGGLAHAHVEALLGGFAGSTTLHGIFGASAAIQGHRALNERLALSATLRGGADRGVQLTVLDEPALSLASAFLGLEVGVTF